MGCAVTPVELLNECHRRGVELAAAMDSDMLLFRPADRVTPELRTLLAAHKPALLRLLTADGGEARDAATVPFALTPRQTADAVAAWFKAGAPLLTTCQPVASGAELLQLRRQWRRSATRRR